ncbi:MAG: GIY-YIG nuclease family protein [Clostridiales bacterium]|nr:GIY-YIG nuclease family protein [Clostridiales bacterium]
MTWYVYMLRCGDGSLYTGSTTDVERRLREHQGGTGARYTRSRPPVTLAYAEEAPDRSAAQRREAAIKKLPRAQKLKLIGKGERT